MSTGNTDNISGCAGLSAIGIIDRKLIHLDIHIFRKLIHQLFSSVPELICRGSRKFDHVDLLVQGCHFLGNGVHLVNCLLDFQVNVLLELLQVSVHIVKVICQCLCRGNKLCLGIVTACVGRHRLKRSAHLVEHRLKSTGPIIIEIVFKGSHVILLRGEFSVVAAVIPIFHIIKMISHTLDCYGVNTGTGTSIGGEGAQCIIGLLFYHLAAVAACLGIGNIVCRCIECRVGSPKPRARNIESEKL